MGTQKRNRLRQDVIPAGLRRLLYVSAGAHVLVVVGVMISSSVGHSADPPRQNFIATKLVRLGKKRDKTMLPRIPTKAPPPAREAVALETSKTTKAPASEKKRVPTAKERLTQMSSLSNALARVRKTADDPEGDPEGVEGGEVTDAGKAIMGQKFATEIYRCMKKNFAVEGIDPSKVKNKQATVSIRVQPDGTLFDFKIQQRSGNKTLDSSVLAAVRRCGKVSAPPEPLKETLRKQGILVEFKP